MATTVVTGKTATFTYDSVAGTAQITTWTADESASPETIETLGGTAVLSATKERTVECEFLFDGDVATSGGFYGACKAAFDDGLSGTLSATIDGATFSGTGIVSALSTPVPADGAVTCTATFTLSAWTYTAPST
jgi:hypothetical protein